MFPGIFEQSCNHPFFKIVREQLLWGTCLSIVLSQTHTEHPSVWWHLLNSHFYTIWPRLARLNAHRFYHHTRSCKSDRVLRQGERSIFPQEGRKASIPPCFSCRYTIDRLTDMDRVFNVHAGNGSVFTLRELDREEHAWHNISVIATEFSKCKQFDGQQTALSERCIISDPNSQIGLLELIVIYECQSEELAWSWGLSSRGTRMSLEKEKAQFTWN